jgi:hypothetical protein
MLGAVWLRSWLLELRLRELGRSIERRWKHIRAGFESPRPTADLTASVTVMVANVQLWIPEDWIWGVDKML